MLTSIVSLSAEGGYSNYLPGSYGDFGMALEPADGLTIRNDIYYYNASDNKRIKRTGVKVDGELTTKINMLTMLYKTDKKFFGGSYAFGTMIPIVDVRTEGSAGNFSTSASESGLGDITLVPGMLFWNYNNFHFSLGEYIIVPTADYDKDVEVNVGLNYYSFDTNFAATYLNPKTGQDYSVNIGHIYNTENHDTGYQSGQEIHVDMALNQFLSNSLAIGIHGFYLNQFKDDRADNKFTDDLIGGFRGKAIGVGPALMWSTNLLGEDVTFITKWLHEVEAENRIEGDHIYFSFALTL